MSTQRGNQYSEGAAVDGDLHGALAVLDA